MHNDDAVAQAGAQVYGYRRKRLRWPWVAALVLVLVAAGIAGAFLVPKWLGPKPPVASPQMAKRAASYSRLGRVPNVLWPNFDWSPGGQSIAVVVAMPGNLWPSIPAPAPMPTGNFNPTLYTPAQLQLWDVTAGRARNSVTLAYDQGGVLWSPDGKLVSVSTISATQMTPTIIDGVPVVPSNVTLFDATSLQVTRQITLAPPADVAAQEANAPPGDGLAYRKTLLGWADGGRYLVVEVELTAGNPQYNSFAGKPGGYLHHTSLQLFDTQTGALLQTIVLSPDPAKLMILHMRLSPDGKTLAMAYHDLTPQAPPLGISVGLWDVASGKRLPSPPPFERAPGVSYNSPQDLCRLAWSPDGSTVAVANAGTVRLLDVRSGRFTAQLPRAKAVTPTPTPAPPTAAPTGSLPVPPLAAPSVPIAAAPQPVSTVIISGSGPPAPGLPYPQPNLPMLPFPNPFAPAPQGPAPSPTVDPNNYGAIKDVLWSSGGDTLVTFDGRVVRFWDVAAGTTSKMIDLGSNMGIHIYPSTTWRKTFLLALSPDSQMLLAHDALSPGPISTSLWETSTGVQLRQLTRDAFEFDWSPRPDLFALHNGRDNALELWGVRP